MDKTYSDIVVHGDHYGRTLGFPTANLPHQDTDVEPGVYAGTATRYTGAVHKAAIVVVPNQDQNIQAHLLDFNEDLYDQTISFTLMEFIRPWMNLPVEELKEQIKKDISQIDNLIVI